MTLQIESRQSPIAAAKAMQGYAQRALDIQTECAESLVQAHRHWIEQFQTEWMEALDFVRRFHSNDTVVDKVDAVQTWMRGVTERGIRDANYAIEVGRALGSIELKMFATPPDAKDVETPKAA
jgi:hypothetical protein